ncbi:hypothetical protein pCPXV0051 [Cowpox virus]|uniref:Uncharacterized protein n=1 Tax=Cowpox virus TaxID=10243 RepID=A0A212PVI3_COWPX|nr:hypothetical protein pCPXV0051 [Cowpox virus]SNB50558.1 hypothetical protein pCPXV0051 [Cowpox virus]SNB50838.1 hypothetical protein pCPXV0051 [Cowpox virus]SNB51806.1 hypothetical protein pCPXV0051 [Cowpox virus]SNB53575.1 hypothetical protein pCPXV0051 [Cowpox virus]
MFVYKNNFRIQYDRCSFFKCFRYVFFEIIHFMREYWFHVSTKEGKLVIIFMNLYSFTIVFDFRKHS